MMDSRSLDRLAARIATAEERLNRSHELAQVIGETLLRARDASWRSRELLAEGRDEEPLKVRQRDPPNAGDDCEASRPQGPLSMRK
jgi:hypothetical protein